MMCGVDDMMMSCNIVVGSLFRSRSMMVMRIVGSRVQADGLVGFVVRTVDEFVRALLAHV